MKKVKVIFYPDNKIVEVTRDTTIFSAAMSAGVYINSACAGDGVCGKCKVILKKGSVSTQPGGNLSQDEKGKGVYLACLTIIHTDAEIEIPPESRVDFQKLAQDDLEFKRKGLYSEIEDIEDVEIKDREDIFVHSPLATKLFLKIPKPNVDDSASDLERIYRQINKMYNNPLETGLVNIRSLGELLRDSNWEITVTLGRKNDTTEVIFFEPADTSKNNFGICFDIGTTTVSCQLIDLNSKKILGTRASYNKQASFGSDVITRIVYSNQPDGLEKLHRAVIDTMDQMILELIKDNSIDLNDVTCVVCAGNTTMIHLLLQIDPSHIRKDPYIPTANQIPTIRAQEAGIRINPRGLLYCVPGVASYVGADVTAGILSSELYKQEQLCLLIDIGTNGEIVLGNKDFMISAAASAGPAFEGSGVKCGMRASYGAIQKIKIPADKKDLNYDTIGASKPRGICGSGYIDLITQMLKRGIIDKAGKITLTNSSRVRDNDYGREFVVAFKEESDSSDDIVITEPDIDNIKRAKAAIYSACEILLKHMNLSFSDISKFYIAGGFGNYLDIDNSICIGLLPDLERNKFVFIGNSSLAGARQVLLSYQAMKKAEEISKKITYFELSVDPAYMESYMAALFFPHTDLKRFPSVRG